MLKKAKSFKEKFKKGALNKASTSSSTLRATLARNLSISGRDKKRNSNESGDKKAPQPVRPTTLGDEKTQLVPEVVHPNVQKVQNEKRKVQQALKYINFAIDKCNMVLLPGSATVALETTFELITLITDLLSAEEPSAELTYHLTCTYNALAELIEWSDQVMLMDSKSQIDVLNAKRVIKGIENSVDELTDYTCDIAKHLKVQTTPTYSTMTLPSKARQRRAANSEDRAKRNSMPEVPLTPREKTILRETSLGAFDNPLALEKGDSPLSPSQPIQFVSTEDSPPPKPYLPPGFNLMKTLSRSSSVETPPELPIKKSLMSRSEIMNNSVDSLDGGHYSPITDSSSSSRPHSAFFPNVDSYNNIVNRHNMMYVRSDRSGGSGGQLFSSHDSLDGPVGKRSSIVSSSSASSASYSAQLRLMSDGGRVFLTHAEDLSPIQPISGLTSAGSVSGHNLDTSDLSNQIDQLKMGFMKGSASHHSKPRCRLSSDYDNVSVGSYDSPTPPAANVMSTSEVWQTESSRSFMHRSFDGLTTTNHWHQKQMSGQAYIGLHHQLEQKTSPDSLRVASPLHRLSNSHTQTSYQSSPPPLPPKRRHVESYMHVFGAGELSEFHPVDNNHFKQFYLHEQERYELELFHSRSAFMTGGMHAYPQSHNSDICVHQAQFMNHQNALIADRDEPVTDVNLFAVQATDDTSARCSMLPDDDEDEEDDYAELNPLDMVDVRDLLVRDDSSDSTSNSSSGAGSKQSAFPSSKRSSKILSGLKGGSVDALVIYATHVGKHDFMYQEAFLTTYRTFLTPEELIDKLLYRYNKFSHAQDVSKKRLSRNAFSLLVRVVDELTSSELVSSINLRLLRLVAELVREGELTLAKIMRRKLLEKFDPNQKPIKKIEIVVSAPKSPLREATLIDFKSQELAEQLTLLENDFYQRLELPELLIWSREQNEEKCPNLVEFTEHFNKISWWCRNLILKPDDPTTREKYFIKFVHILKHLRKHNNFNSLLALLSALDSAPISRLDWPKQEKEMIQEYFSLIDCTSSFKSYRMTLAEAQPPCIPYIGLILNDMTIIRVGNTAKLADGDLINFQMRWQLFNVLECLRRFRKPVYPFQKDQNILQFLDDFNDYNSNDDEMWERSKEIKPTSTK